MGEILLHNLQTHIDDYGCDVFIETGTGVGEGICHALRYPFKELYSFEYVGQLYEHCKNNIVDDRLELFHTDTLTGLNNILPKISPDSSILFWLDAHFPGADFKFNDYDHMSDQPSLHMPLKDEIATIKTLRPNSLDVFIIDDLQIYEGDVGIQIPNPSGFNEKYGMGGIGFIEEAYDETHNFLKDYRHQGFLILTPKKDN